MAHLNKGAGDGSIDPLTVLHIVSLINSRSSYILFFAKKCTPYVYKEKQYCTTTTIVSLKNLKPMIIDRAVEPQ
jgi:hypothetical protein